MTTVTATVTATALCVPLDEVGVADVDRVGGKAATLGELRRAGFPVPPGMVLTTAALDAALAGAEPTSTAVRDLPLPDTVTGALVEALAALTGTGGGPVAVRSSGVAEDLADRSFAGQYTSRLDVTGPADVADAVRECWSSAYDERVRAYVAAGAPEAAGRMAVLIQASRQAMYRVARLMAAIP